MCKSCVVPMTGDLVFTRSMTPVSWAIRNIIKCPYSHVGVYFGDGLMIESDWAGVQFVKLAKYSGRFSSYQILPISDTLNRDVFIKSFFDHIGDEYDYTLLFGNLAQRLTFGYIPFTKMFDAPGRWICSEIVASALKDAGAKFDRELYDINPAHLYDYFGGNKRG